MREYTEETLKHSKIEIINGEEYVTCPFCDGAGECYTSHRWDCGDCNGRGKVTVKVFKERIEKAKLSKKKWKLIDDIKYSLSSLNIEQLEMILATVKTLRE